MSSKILDNNSEWHKKVIDYLESCHTGDFMTGTQEDIVRKVSLNSKVEGYCDPTQTNPDSPSSMCKLKHNAVDKITVKPVCKTLLGGRNSKTLLMT